jgi:hypothetical protein
MNNLRQKSGFSKSSQSRQMVVELCLIVPNQGIFLNRRAHQSIAQLLYCFTCVLVFHDNLLNKEAQIIGVSDHLASELPLLLDLARRGKLQIPPAVTRIIPLDAHAINAALHGLEGRTDHIRTVIKP